MSVEYRTQFRDRHRAVWTIDIENDAYSSTIKEMLLAEAPLKFQFLGASEDLLYPPIKGSLAEFKIISDSHFKYAALYAVSDFTYKVNIYKQRTNGQILTGWTGGYPTFVTSGTTITSAITDGGFYHAAYSNLFPIKKGNGVTIQITLALNSGTAPYIVLAKNTEAGAKSNLVNLVNGVNTVTLIATEDMEDALVVIENNLNPANWSTNAIVVEYTRMLFWTGWVAPGNYSEPYDTAPYIVNIACGDGLGVLKNIQFKDEEEYYNGRMTEAAILIEILNKVEITSFNEYINIYEEDFDDGVGDSPLDQTYIDVDIFQDMHCYEVLEYLLSKWKAIIRQKNGEIHIYRPIELYEDTVYGRKFTSATAKTAIVLTPEQYFSRKTNPTDLLAINGGTMMIETQVKDIIVNHDYRYKESWLDNWKFAANQFRASGSDYVVDYWPSNTGTHDSPKPRPASEYAYGELEGVYLAGFNDKPLIPNWDVFISQTFGHYANITSSTTVYNLSIDFAFYNRFDYPYDCSFEIIIRTVSGSHYLKGRISMEEWTWTTDADEGYIYYYAGKTPAGLSDWTTLNKRIIGLPAKGPYIVRILTKRSGTSPTPLIRNVKFVEEGLALTIKRNKISNWELFLFGRMEATYRRIKRNTLFTRIFEEKRITIERQYTETVNEYGEDYEEHQLLGDVTDSNLDNVIEQFGGALGKLDSGDEIAPTAIWNRRGRTDDISLLELNKVELKALLGRPYQKITIPVYDQNVDSAFNLIGNVKDPLNEFAEKERCFVVNTAEFTPRDALWSLSLVEIADPGDVEIPVPPTIDGAPSAFTATPESYNIIQLAWVDGCTNEEGFYLERSLDESTWTMLTITAAGATGYRDIDLEQGTTYYYRLRGFVGDSYGTAVTANAETGEELSITATPNALEVGWLALEYSGYCTVTPVPLTMETALTLVDMGDGTAWASLAAGGDVGEYTFRARAVSDNTTGYPRSLMIVVSDEASDGAESVSVILTQQPQPI